MSKGAVVYRLECAWFRDGEWSKWFTVIDEESRPITFGGPPGKAQAINFCKELSRHPVHDALRVRKNQESEAVWSWTRKA